MSNPEQSVRLKLRPLNYAAVALLLGVLTYGTSESLHAQLLSLGESLFPEYHSLRIDPEKPSCDLEDLKKKLVLAQSPGAAKNADDEGDLDDLLDDDEDDEAAAQPAQGAAEDELDSLLDDDEAEAKVPPAKAVVPSDEDELDDLLGDDDDEAPESETGDAAQALREEGKGPAAPEPGQAVEPAEGPEAETGTSGAVAEKEGAAGIAETEAVAAAVPGQTAPGQDGDDLDDLLDDDDDEDEEAAEGTAAGATATAKVNPAVLAWQKAIQRCEGKHASYLDTNARLTPGAKRFRAIETTVAAVVSLGVAHLSHLLALLLLLCAFATTVLDHHISLRPPKTRGDQLVTNWAQLVANLMLLHSSWAYKEVEAATGGAEIAVGWIWVIGFAAICLVNIYKIITSGQSESMQAGGISVKSLLTVPLYVIMALISGTYFIVSEGHYSGLAIYLSRLAEHAILYLHVGLYVWVGMLLKRTYLASLCFDVVRPWRLPPELLAFVAVVGAALPTAYSGASGIFVIAVGATIYEELRRAGARRQLALAATAMSGSMGVVLRPCLLVVIVASLNKQVTTDQLYEWGFRVFLLTAVLFLLVSLLNRQGPMKAAPASEAVPGMFSAFRRLVPYLVIAGVLMAIFSYGLNAHLDEHSAPMLLPLLLMGILAYDRFSGRTVTVRDSQVPFKFRKALGSATAETTGHIGALLMLMGLSVCLGGIIERADLMAMVPETFGSVWITMSVLVAVLVVIGMTMDPYGAVILVSATIADVAYRNGIDAIHFWMVVLVAFELGYLTPPVALNHLLSRQVVGDKEFELAASEGTTFYQRHERILLPITVMGIALILVAFVPLMLAG